MLVVRIFIFGYYVFSNNVGKCDIGIDIVRESELGNFQCEEIEGCEWMDIGGKNIEYYACCPKDKLLKIVDGKRVYVRCLMRVD